MPGAATPLILTESCGDINILRKICVERTNTYNMSFCVYERGVPKMSSITSPPEQESAGSPDARRAFRVSFKGTIVLVVFVVAMAAAIAFLYRQQSPWVEIIGQDLLRTNAPSKTIASARDAVIHKHQNWIVGDDGKQSDPSYRSGGRAWSAGPSREEIRVKANAGKDANHRQGRALFCRLRRSR